MTRSFSCANASEVTRREGPDIGCGSKSTNQMCVSCFDALKSRALPELGFDDDLTTMPASALQKIQYGGLIAIRGFLDGQETNDPIDNIADLVESVIVKFGSPDDIPFDQCVETIKHYKIKRRRGK